MTDQEINQAIAEALGIGKRFVLVKRGLYYRPNACGYTSNLAEAWVVDEATAEKHVYPHDEPVTRREIGPANYCADLNAMHEAEKVLKVNATYNPGCLWKLYEIILARSVKGDCGMIHITARQRAEAFLRTLGKWRE